MGETVIELHVIHAKSKHILAIKLCNPLGFLFIFSFVLHLASLSHIF